MPRFCILPLFLLVLAIVVLLRTATITAALCTTDESTNISGRPTQAFRKVIPGTSACAARILVSHPRSVPPPPLQLYRRRICLHTTTDSSSSNNGDERAKNSQGSQVRGHMIVDRLVVGFWKGLTFPFPILRGIILPRALKGQQQQQRRDRSRFTVGLSFREGLAAVCCYLAVGVIAYSYVLEKWSIADALYFTCVCFSTVGYGSYLEFSFFASIETHFSSSVFFVFLS
jgi:Ion channel